MPGYEGYPMWQAPNQISGGGPAPRSEGFTPPVSETSWFASLTDPDGNEIGLYEGTTDAS